MCSHQDQKQSPPVLGLLSPTMTPSPNPASYSYKAQKLAVSEFNPEVTGWSLDLCVCSFVTLA